MLLLLKGVLQKDLLDIEVTTSFGVQNIQEIEAMRIMFVCKMLIILCRFQKRNKNLKKISGFLDNCIWIGCSKFSL